MKTMIKKTTFLFAVVVFLGFGGNVFAENKIDVQVSGDDSRMFNEHNIYPGWSQKKTVKVTNESDTSITDLYMDFGIDNGKTLASDLKIYVINSGGSYRIGGTGDKYTLKKAGKKGALFVEKLGPGESKKYTIKVKFDKDAGNDTQKKDTQFDIDFKIMGETSENTAEEILTSQGRTVTGKPPEDETAENGSVTSSNAKQSQGAVEGVTNNGKVKGASACHSWPLWIWVFIVVIYGIIATAMSRDAITLQKKKIALFWQIALAVLSVGLWYFFDTCRNYNWEPIITLIMGGALIVMMYRKQDPSQPPKQSA